MSAARHLQHKTHEHLILCTDTTAHIQLGLFILLLLLLLL
jgi:hypothetical protein